MIQTTPSSTGALWARFRFSVVGSLLSSPPARGALQTAIHPSEVPRESHLRSRSWTLRTACRQAVQQ